MCLQRWIRKKTWKKRIRAVSLAIRCLSTWLNCKRIRHQVRKMNTKSQIKSNTTRLTTCGQLNSDSWREMPWALGKFRLLTVISLQWSKIDRHQLQSKTLWVTLKICSSSWGWTGKKVLRVANILSTSRMCTRRLKTTQTFQRAPRSFLRNAALRTKKIMMICPRSPLIAPSLKNFSHKWCWTATTKLKCKK